MIKVAYTSPFIPPEWIAAHGLRPVWMQAALADTAPADTALNDTALNDTALNDTALNDTALNDTVLNDTALNDTALNDTALGKTVARVAAPRGVCSYVDRLLDAVALASDVGAIVVCTGCDQMRYAAAYLQQQGVPIFLFNLPSTWQNEAVQQLYRAELVRLGSFLESVGGASPSEVVLQRELLRYGSDPRVAARACWPAATDEGYGAWLAELRNDGSLFELGCSTNQISSGVPLAVVGGPLGDAASAFFEMVATAGGRIVLDASEWGERTLPAPFDEARLASDPLKELTRTYFTEIPDVFQRPNTRLYAWLTRHLAARGVQGILFWRRVFCDLWHAELEPMRSWSPVPVLDLDAVEGDRMLPARTQGRIEAFLEMFS